NVAENLLFHFQAPGLNRRSLQIRLNAAGNYLCSSISRNRRNARKRNVFNSENSVEGPILIEPVTQIVEKRIVGSESGSNHSFLRTMRRPSNGNTRSRKKFRIVGGKRRVANNRLCENHARLAERIV